MELNELALEIVSFTYGNKNAAVFPDPVWAQPIRSLFAIMQGMAVF